MSAYPGLSQEIHQYHEFKSFKEYFDTHYGALPPIDPNTPVKDEIGKSRGIASMDSRLLGIEHMAAPELVEALRAATPKSQGGVLRGHLVGGAAVMKNSGNSVNPAWRRAYVHLISTGKDANATSLKKLAPDMGSYSNEVSLCYVEVHKG